MRGVCRLIDHVPGKELVILYNKHHSSRVCLCSRPWHAVYTLIDSAMNQAIILLASPHHRYHRTQQQQQQQHTGQLSSVVYRQ